MIGTARRAAAALSHRAAASPVPVMNVPLRDPSLLSLLNLDAASSRRFRVRNPAAPASSDPDGDVVAEVVAMDRTDARKAVEAAAEALPSWRDGITCVARSKILRKWSELIQENKNDIATIMTTESGKPFAESAGEIDYATSFLDFYAAECLRPSAAGGGTIFPTTFAHADGSPRGRIMAVREAIGVTAMITPWNFPIAMITRKVGPALAAGCAAVVKPSELTPLTAVAVRTLANRAGVPEGAFGLVTADEEDAPEVGREFCENPIVKKISFTGSTAVGKLLMRQSSDTVKRVALELGGNAPFLVFEDADVDAAVSAAVASKLRNAGQTCVSADRFLVHRSIEDEFCSKLAARVGGTRVGPPRPDPSCSVGMGPLVSPAAVERVAAKVDEATASGAERLVGGGRLPDLGPSFFAPTVLRDVDRSSRLWRDETFGPVAAVSAFDDEEEAVGAANDTTTGLAAYVCCGDADRATRVPRRLESGMVGVNEGIISTATAPFGGVKESGLGREGSVVGLEEYLETKYVFLNHD